MTVSDLEFLSGQNGSSEGKELLFRLSASSESAWHSYLRKSEPEKRAGIGAAISVILSRQKAVGKFRLSEKMFFTPLGLEQSSGERVAEHIAKRYHSDWTVADLSCGIGGNMISLAARCKKAIGVERDEVVLKCAELNLSAYDLSDKSSFSLSSAEDFLARPDVKTVDAFFLDPARDREGKTKTRSILNSSPKLLEILPEIFKITKNVGVKISPAFDWEEIDLLPERPEVEVISENNNCKVAMLWFGNLKRAERSASCLRKNDAYLFSTAVNKGEKEDGLVILDEKAKAKTASVPGKYIFEPDKAIGRSGLFDAFAACYGLNKLGGGSPYLCGDNDMPESGRLLSVLGIYELSLRDFKKEIDKLGIKQADISARGYFLKPEEIYKKLKIKEGGDFAIVFTPLSASRSGIILAKRVADVLKYKK